MRIWLVPFQELDDQRVVGQRYEFRSIYRFVVEDVKELSQLLE